MENILFLALIFDKEKENYYLEQSKNGLQNAVNNYQWNLIDGFIANHSALQIINVLPVGTYPNAYKGISLPDKEWDYHGIKCYECGGLNIPVIKQIERENKVYCKILQWAKESSENKHIICYSLYLPFTNAIKRIKKKYPDIGVTTIVTDLPSYYGMLPKNPLKRGAMVLFGERMIANTKYSDSFVLLTKQMSGPLKVGKRPYVIVEGICPDSEPAPLMAEKEAKKVVFYSGTLHFQYGIKNLLDAFSMIDEPNVELWICGSGEAEEEIRVRSKTDQRIRFFGFCSSEKVAELRAQAMVLVNPRTNEGVYTKYSFPSKTIEYMASGIPVVMYKLAGIPEEYATFLYYVQENGVVALRDAIARVLNTSDVERFAFGKRAQAFVLQEKTAQKQAEKIIGMML